MKLFDSLFALLRRHRKTLLLIIVVSTATILISSAISMWLSDFHNLHLPTIGTIKTIGVEAYWDSNCENKTETIDWSTIWPGSSKNVTFYIRSVSNFKATLKLNATNWNPANISNYINLSWGYNETPLNPGEIIQVTLTLSAPFSNSFVYYLIANDVKSFSFNIIIISASEINP